MNARARRAAAILAVLAACGAPGPAAAGAERIVALAPHLAELACAAGGCDRLVGAVAYTDYPPQASRLPQVGDAFSVDAERVLALHPDLVLAWDGGTPRDVTARLRSLGLRVEALAVRDLASVAAALRQLGRWIGTEETAVRAAEDYGRRLDALRRAFSGRAPVRVLYQIEHSPIYTVNRDSPISQAIELCGGRNVFAGLSQIAAPVTRESVVAADPQAVVFGRQDDVAAIRDAWHRTPPVTATRIGALYAVDADLLARSTPRLLDGVEALCGVLEDARARLAREDAVSRATR